MSVHPLLSPIGGLRQLVGGDPGLRRLWRWVPSNGRCKQCVAQFFGPFSLPFRLLQLRPSRKNPNLCTV